MTADSDTDLLARMRSGDREAYAVLVARHIGMVQTACRRQAAPGDEDDCVQAVFLIFERKPAAASGAPVLAAWLLRVAWYVCRNSRRIAQRRRQAERDAVAATTGGSRPEALDHLDDCLQRLPSKQRDAVTLHFLSGKPAEEVAAALGTSRDNAYQLISRGLAGLRQQLARRGVAMAGAGLASVLAAEAQAASSAVQPALLASLSGTPSIHVTALSNGALRAMTIATLTPFAAVAGFALTIGSTALLLAAEPVAPAGPPPAPPVAAPAVPPALDLKAEWRGKQLVQLVSPAWNPAWSPDGRRLAYITRPAGDPKGIALAIVDLASGVVVTGAALAAEDKPGASAHTVRSYVAWKPDSKSILVGVAHRLFIVEASTAVPGKARDIPTLPQGEEPMNLAWSLGGEAFYTHTVEGISTGFTTAGSIRLFTADGKLISRFPKAYGARWSPEGKSCYAWSDGLLVSLRGSDGVVEQEWKLADLVAALPRPERFRSGGNYVWLPEVEHCQPDGSLLIRVRAYAKEPVFGSLPEGVLLLWRPDAPVRLLGDTAFNPVGRWVAWQRLGPDGGRLLRYERGAKTATCMDLRSAAQREIPLPAALAGTTLELDAFQPPAGLGAATAMLNATLRQAAGAAKDPEQLLRDLAQRAQESGDLSQLSNGFNGDPVLLLLDVDAGSSRRIPLRSAIGQMQALPQPGGGLIALAGLWRWPDQPTLLLCDPSGEGLLELSR